MGALSLVTRQVRTAALRRRWILALATLGLTTQPLVGTLGYECSVALTPLMSVLGVFVGVDAVRRASAASLDGILRTAARDLLGLAGTAVGVLAIAELWHPSCDPWTGLLFFALGPVISGGLAAVAGICGAMVVQRPPRRWLQALCAFIPLIAALVLGLLRLYVDPAVFAFDPFWGYFAGPIYDEGIAIDDRVLSYRFYNLLVAAAALSAARLWGEPALLGEPHMPLSERLARRPWAALCLAMTTIGGAWYGLQPAHHGFHATVGSIREILPGTRVTEHFVIHYAPTAETAREIDVVAAEHEFAWHRLYHALGRAPAAKIESFIFPNPELKRRVIGAGNTEVAPPWRLHLYLNHQPFPAAVMHHELAHAFESTIGDPIFGASARLAGGPRLNLALIEGFATAMAPRARDGLDLHDMAAVLDRLELRPPLGSIMGVAFWGQASRRAYTAAGSFCRWLLDTRGAAGLIELYRSAGDFEATYGTSLAALEVEWLSFLRARTIRPQDLEAMRQIFEHRSIFQRPCAHRAADLRAEASSAQSRGLEDDAAEALATLCAIEPDRPEHQIQRAGALSRGGRWDEARRALERALAAPALTATLRAVVDDNLGDLALVRGDLGGAAASYREALGRSSSEAQTRTLQVKLLGATTPSLGAAIRDYFMPFESAALRPTMPVRHLHAALQIAQVPGYAPLGEYLAGLQLLGIEDPEAALPHLERSLAVGDDEVPLPSVELVRSARLHLVNALVRTRRYDRAGVILDALEAEPGIGNGHRMTYSEWRERIVFFRGALPGAATSTTSLTSPSAVRDDAEIDAPADAPANEAADEAAPAELPPAEAAPAPPPSLEDP